MSKTAGTNQIQSNQQVKMTGSLKEDKSFLDKELAIDENYDVINRVVQIGGKEASLYFINGFCKDDMLQQIMRYFIDIPPAEMPETADDMVKIKIPHVDAVLNDEWDTIIRMLLSGVFLLLIDGYKKALLIDARSFPARSVTEPDKDKVLRGSKDGFVETIVSNSALIRRRIRSTDLRMEVMSAGKSSRTDIVICYMDSRVEHSFLDEIKKKIENIKVDALTMNQESLAECLFNSRWFNPFPKFKYTERPDTAAAQILEGNIIILVDNSPSAMIVPTSIFDVIEEADDYYFPPITGTYLRLTRFLISILTYIMTPTFLLLMTNRHWIPHSFSFIILESEPHIPLIWQFLILELAIDGLRLAAVSTPNMLSTPLSVMAALVLGEFSVQSGWFSSEVMLYMAFVAIANYTQSNFELGYALKFMRMLTLILTAIFGLWGYIAGIVICVLSIACNRTISHQSYIYPFIPFNLRRLMHRLFRIRIPGAMEREEHPKSR